VARRQLALDLEELGPRTLPSITPLVPIADPLVGLPAQQATLIHLRSDHAHGGYWTDPIQSGAGAEYHLRGAGHLAGLGDVHVQGTIDGVGFIQHGQAHGQLTFSNVWGSVTIEVTGPAQPAFTTPEGQFTYHVINRTGAGTRAHLPDRGTLDLSVTPAPTAYGMAARGTFQLALWPLGVL
jgi:hypothetical protein